MVCITAQTVTNPRVTLQVRHTSGVRHADHASPRHRSWPHSRRPAGRAHRFLHVPLGRIDPWRLVFHQRMRQQCCSTMARTSLDLRHVLCVTRPQRCPKARSRRAATGGASDAGSTGMPRDWRRSPRTRRGAAITIAQAGKQRMAVTRPSCTAIRRPTGWAANRDGRRGTPRRSDADEDSARGTVRSDPGARRSRSIPARRRCCRRPGWGGGDRTLHPIRDLGHRHTDRAVCATAGMDGRASAVNPSDIMREDEVLAVIETG